MSSSPASRKSRLQDIPGRLSLPAAGTAQLRQLLPCGTFLDKKRPENVSTEAKMELKNTSGVKQQRRKFSCLKEVEGEKEVALSA